MTLRNLIFALAFALTATFATGSSSIAQSMGATGKTYLKDTYRAWEIRCLQLEAGGERCQMFQQLNESPGNPVAEVNIFAMPADQGAAAGGVIIVPLETLLTSELTLEISGLQRKRYPFAWCTSVGCLARIAITPDELSALMSETLATITIVPITTPTTRMSLPVSLLGFTAAFNAMQAANNPS